MQQKRKGAKFISSLLETYIFRETKRDLKTKHKNSPVHHSCSQKRYIVKVIVISQQGNILKQKRERYINERYNNKRYNNERYNNERYNNERYNDERYRTPGERCSSDFAGPWSMVRSECTLCLRLAGNLHARPPPIVHFDLHVHCALRSTNCYCACALSIDALCTE